MGSSVVTGNLIQKTSRWHQVGGQAVFRITAVDAPLALSKMIFLKNSDYMRRTYRGIYLNCVETLRHLDTMCSDSKTSEHNSVATVATSANQTCHAVTLIRSGPLRRHCLVSHHRILLQQLTSCPLASVVHKRTDQRKFMHILGHRGDRLINRHRPSPRLEIERIPTRPRLESR